MTADALAADLDMQDALAAANLTRARQDLDLIRDNLIKDGTPS